MMGVINSPGWGAATPARDGATAGRGERSRSKEDGNPPPLLPPLLAELPLPPGPGAASADSGSVRSADEPADEAAAEPPPGAASVGVCTPAAAKLKGAGEGVAEEEEEEEEEAPAAAAPPSPPRATTRLPCDAGDAGTGREGEEDDVEAGGDRTSDTRVLAGGGGGLERCFVFAT
jgi:hypothetical protein